MVLALHAEKAVNPSVLVCSQAHVVDVGGRLAVFRHGDRPWPEAEIVHSVGAFRYGEEGLAVICLHPGYKQVFAVPFDCTAVEDSVYAYPLHQERVVLFVKFVPPLNRSMCSREYRVFVTLVHAIDINGFVLEGQEIFMFRPQIVELFFPVHILIQHFDFSFVNPLAEVFCAFLSRERGIKVIALVFAAGVAPSQHVAYSAAFNCFLKHSGPPLRGIEPLEACLCESIRLAVEQGEFLQPGKHLLCAAHKCFIRFLLALSGCEVCVVVHANKIYIFVPRVAICKELPVA